MRKKTEENGKIGENRKTEKNRKNRKRHRSGDPFCEIPIFLLPLAALLAGVR